MKLPKQILVSRETD